MAGTNGNGKSNGNGHAAHRNAAPCLIAGCKQWSQHRSGVCEGHRTFKCTRCLVIFKTVKYDALLAKKPKCPKCRALDRRAN